MKKLLCLLCAAALSLCFALPALANTGLSRPDYLIEEYNISALLHEDNTVSQQERILVDFSIPSHGIYRVLPQSITMEKETADGAVSMAYRAKVRDISVRDGETGREVPFETKTRDGLFFIRIGDEDVERTGRHTYVLSFTYDIGDDRVDGYDELFYTLNGGWWDAPIQNFSFSFTFEKPLTREQRDALALYSGPYGGTGNDADVSFTWADEATLRGSAGRKLYPQESVSLYLRLPEGYFSGERTAPLWAFWALGGACAALALYTLARALVSQRKKPVAAMECAPPDGISSAEVGYIIDNSADDRDILSLILWFAGRGYLSIEGDGDAMRLTRKGSLPQGSPEYQAIFFGALFPDGAGTCALGALTPEFHEKLQQAKQSLAAHFSGERALYKKGSAGRALALGFACAALWGAAGTACGAFVTGASAAFGIGSGVALLFFCLLVHIAAERWTFFERGGRIGWGVGLGLFAAGTTGLAYGAACFALAPLWAVLAVYTLAMLACIASPRIAQPTAYRLEMAGRLLGLRAFIEESELPRLRELTQVNIAYFYDVLPYAEVFGLAEEWSARFAELAVPPPAWYGGADPALWSAVWFSRMMRRSVDSSLSHLQQTIAESAGGAGAGSFGTGGVSGGGFSGGGFGGGGGGRW